MNPWLISCFRTRAKRLLGDFQNIEQLRHAQTRVPVDEMQHPMMGAAEAVLGQNLVGFAREIAIGEKQQLRASDKLIPALGVLLRPAYAPLGRAWNTAAAGPISRYVSHVDLFAADC